MLSAGKRSKILIILLVPLFLFLFWVPADAQTKAVRLSIATGGTGGVYYVMGGGIAALISKYMPNAEATAEVTAASVDNMKLIMTQKADIAFTTAMGSGIPFHPGVIKYYKEQKVWPEK